MKQVENYISSGLKDYAIALNGKWGKGKTYYIEEVLTPWIEDSLKLKVFYFSLNGVSSTEELHNLIVTKSTVNYFSGGIKALKEIGKRVEKIASSIDKLKSAKNAFKFSDYHLPEKTIVILDDLERLSEKYTYQELLGYLNREFIERHKFRTIIVGDFSQERVKDSELPRIKEKYIRWTIDFKTKIKEIYPELIKSFKSNKDYTKHLIEYTEYIADLFKSLEIDNIRTIKFFLEVYENIFIVLDKKKYRLIERHVIYSTLVLAVEYREGTFDSIEVTNELPHLVTQKETTHRGIIYSSIDGSEKDAEAERINNNPNLKKIVENFGKYTYNRLIAVIDNGIKYKYFKEVFKYIISGELDKEKFDLELKEYSKQIKPIFKFQRNPNLDNASSFRTLNEKEFTKNIDDILEKMDSGKLELVHFGRAINLLVYFSEEKLLAISKTELKSLIRKAIKKIPTPKDSTVSFRSPEFFELDRIKKYDVSIYNNLSKLIESENQRRREMQSAEILKNWNKQDDKFNSFRDIITYSNAKEMFEKIKILGTDRDFIEGLIKTIHEYYRTTNAGEFHSQDIPKLKSLLSKLKKEKWELLDKIDRYFINNLKTQLKKSIVHLNNTKPRVTA